MQIMIFGMQCSANFQILEQQNTKKGLKSGNEDKPEKEDRPGQKQKKNNIRHVFLCVFLLCAFFFDLFIEIAMTLNL